MPFLFLSKLVDSLSANRARLFHSPLAVKSAIASGVMATSILSESQTVEDRQNYLDSESSLIGGDFKRGYLIKGATREDRLRKVAALRREEAISPVLTWLEFEYDNEIVLVFGNNQKIKTLDFQQAKNLVGDTILDESDIASFTGTPQFGKLIIPPEKPEAHQFFHKAHLPIGSYQDILRQIHITGLALGDCLQKSTPPSPQQNLAPVPEQCKFPHDRLNRLLKNTNVQNKSDPEAKLAEISVDTGGQIRKDREQYRGDMEEMLTTSYGCYQMEFFPEVLRSNPDGQIMRNFASNYMEEIIEASQKAQETMVTRSRVNQKRDGYLHRFHDAVEFNHDDDLDPNEEFD